MRFVHTKISEPKVGQVRQEKAFLLLPKRILNETRWLETAVFQEQYMELVSEDGLQWIPTDWIND